MAFYGDLLMNHYDPYFSSVFYRLVQLPTVVQTLKIGKSKVELVDKNIWLVNMWLLYIISTINPVIFHKLFIFMSHRYESSIMTSSNFFYLSHVVAL